jgi:hypothetical protein
MATIEATVNALIKTKNQVKEHQKIIKGLRTQEKELVKEIQLYLNERGENGIRVDEKIHLTLANHDKKINMSKKEYEKRVQDMLYNKGIDDEYFTSQLLNKTSNVVQEQKILISKEK